MSSTQLGDRKLNRTQNTKSEIVVLGAGIIGAAIAWRLNRAGASVTLADGNGPGGIASAGSFGWINATYGNPRNYFDLRVASMNEWNVLASQFETLPYRKTGTLYAHFNRVDLSTFQKAHSQWGYKIGWVKSEQINQLEPNLARTPDRCLLAPDEGTVQVEEAAKFFTHQFRNDGGNFVGENATRIEMRDGCVAGVEFNGKFMSTSQVVIAAGTASQILAADLGTNIPMDNPAGLLVRTKPCKPIINRTVLTNGLHIQQLPDGVLLAGTDFGGGQFDQDPEQGAVELMGRIRSAFHGAEDAELDRYTIGYRPTPVDGMPVIGPASDVLGTYISTMHSGATLAPIVSKLVCEEILMGARNRMLEPFHPSRFQLTSAPN